MKSKFILSSLVLSTIASAQAFAADADKSNETRPTAAASTEILWKLSEPDTSRTAFGLSHGSNLRGFFYLDLQNVPASARGAEKDYHTTAYAVGLTFRDRPFGSEVPPQDSPVLRAYSDVLLRYSEASASLGRDGFWTIAVQPGLNFGGAAVSMNLGFEYSLNLIGSKSSAKQVEFLAAGVSSQSLRPAVTLNYRL